MLILFVVGAILSLVGWVMMLIQAFRSSILWGLGILIGPFVIGALFPTDIWKSSIASCVLMLAFAVRHWDTAKTALIISVVGTALGATGMKEMLKQVEGLKEGAQAEEKKAPSEAGAPRPHTPPPAAVLPPTQTVDLPLPPVVKAGKALMDKGQLDEALAKLAELPDDPISLYYSGVIYVRKGMATPLPETGFRPEDKNAAVLLERAIAAKREFAAAHFTLAEVLLPYTLQRHGPGKRRPAKGPSPAPDDPDISPERVARAYQAAVQHDKTSRAPIDALIKYAREMKRPDDADAAYRELLVRDKEQAGPHIAYGDFLANEKKERLKAIEQYQLALVWAPQDPAPKEHALGVYVDWAQDHFDQGENANAEARLRDAQKWVTDPAAPQAQRLRELQAKLAARRR